MKNPHVAEGITHLKEAVPMARPVTPMWAHNMPKARSPICLK